jgi:hypothetical protein
MPKLEPSQASKFIQEKLEEQRHLLQKSIKDVAAGDLIETIRVASIIRVLVHETGSSKPLLKQLTQDYLQLEVLDYPLRESSPPPGMVALAVMRLPISISFKAQGVFLNPNLADGHVPTILGRWWARPALVLPGLGGFSRKEVVLGLVNKEGGAHVDTTIDRKYQQLLSYKSVQIENSEQSLTPLNLSRFMAAQAGVELLDCLQRNFRN